MPLRNIVALLARSTAHCSLFLHQTHLASSSTGGARWLCPAPSALEFEQIAGKTKTTTLLDGCFLGAEGETRTLAPVTRPTPLAGAPRHQLEYFCIGSVNFV